MGFATFRPIPFISSTNCLTYVFENNIIVSVVTNVNDEGKNEKKQ